MTYGVTNKHVVKPWGFEVIWARTDRYAGKMISVDPGKRISLQYHREKDETLMVVEGSAVVEHGDTMVVLLTGESIHIEAGVVHRVSAGKIGCTLVEVSTPELDDVVRLEDDYGRAG